MTRRLLVLCLLVLVVRASVSTHFLAQQPVPPPTGYLPGETASSQYSNAGPNASGAASADELSFDLDHTVDLAPATVGLGEGKLVLDVELPPKHKLSDLANSTIMWQVTGGVVALPGEARVPIAIDVLPVETEATFREGTGELVGDLFLGYCKEGQEGICLLEQVRLRVPVTVREGGEPVLRARHRVTLPDLGDR